VCSNVAVAANWRSQLRRVYIWEDVCQLLVKSCEGTGLDHAIHSSWETAAGMGRVCVCYCYARDMFLIRAYADLCRESTVAGAANSVTIGYKGCCASKCLQLYCCLHCTRHIKQHILNINMHAPGVCQLYDTTFSASHQGWLELFCAGALLLHP
jgi:hypothetical protein